MKNLVKLFGIITLVVMFGFTLAACSDGSDSGGGDIVNNAGEAWVSPWFEDDVGFVGFGFIFKSNGTFDHLYYK